MRAPLTLLTLLVACSSPAPEVDVKTYVGAPHEQADVELSRANTWAVLESALPALLGRANDIVRAAQPNEVSVTHPPRSSAELETLVDAIVMGAMDELGGPARRIASAEPSVWPQIRTLLLAERRAPKGDYRSLLDAIGGDVPNRYGHFARSWKKAHGHQVKLSTDWFEDLLALPRGRISSMLTAVYRDCVLTTALLRAASGIGRHPEYAADVLEALLDAAYMHDGTFRDEVGRSIQAIGNEAIPHLLRASVPPKNKRDDDPGVRRAAYAQVQLDKMDRLHPTRAVAAVRDDPRLLATLLDAYGMVRPGEAAAVLLEFVDARTPAIRDAARRAFEAYVTGPAPKSVSRTVRLIGGGTGRARAYLSYRQRATLALRERLSEKAPDLLDPACDDPETDDASSCEVAPEQWTRAYFHWLDARREASEIAEIDAALAAADPSTTTQRLDRLLALNPELGHADRLVPFYESVAEQAHAEEDHARAARLWRKAAILIASSDMAHANGLRLRALLAEAREPELDDRGRQMLLETAHALDPDDEDVATALGQLRETSSELSAEFTLRFAGGTTLLGMFLLCLMSAVAPLRRWIHIDRSL